LYCSNWGRRSTTSGREAGRDALEVETAIGSLVDAPGHGATNSKLKRRPNPRDVKQGKDLRCGKFLPE